MVFQGSLLQAVPSTVQDIRPLGARLELVFTGGAEGLYRPRGCCADAPTKRTLPDR